MKYKMFCTLIWLINVVWLSFFGINNALAVNYFSLETNPPCQILLEREFQEEIIFSGDSVFIEQTSDVVQEKYKLGFDYFAELRGLGRTGSIHKVLGGDDLVLVIHDRELPCRALLSVVSDEMLPANRQHASDFNGAEQIDDGSSQNQEISSNEILPVDDEPPEIVISAITNEGKQGVIRGRVADKSGVAELIIDGSKVSFGINGNFEFKTFVPSSGLEVEVKATDNRGFTTVAFASFDRNENNLAPLLRFDRLNPLGKEVQSKPAALALIIGVAEYENTNAKALFADNDALMFRDFASAVLGIPEPRIHTLINSGADERKLYLSLKNWLSRAVKQNQSDVYVFFAGHGLASDDGEQMYLLPYDGAPELLDRTAILREELFADIASAKPRSVTVFLDTCYSGTTRGTDMLIASRPIAIKALKQSVPEGFTVMTAAAGDQTAKPLEEAKHGMFSYFLMKGMEGEADVNQDNKITAGELHSYVQTNVIQQSSGSQTPELQGDTNRVLVQFQ